jgi:hypothetical protein
MAVDVKNTIELLYCYDYCGMKAVHYCYHAAIIDGIIQI